MARFTLLLTTWMEQTKENQVKSELKLFIQSLKTERVSDTLPISHKVQNPPPLAF